MSETPATDDADSAGGGRRKGKLHLEAARRLREMILSGELPPGERLREVPLSKRLSVSRTPVREAFRTLAAEGLVDLLPNRSVVVSGLNVTEAEQLFVVFAEIEALAARLACERISDENVSEIGRYLSEMVDCHERRDRAAYLRLNQLIHLRTIEIADNPVLQGVWQTLAPRIERARALPNLDAGRWTSALMEHMKMFAALTARDGPLLADLTRSHFLSAMPFVARAMRGAADERGAAAGTG